MNETFTYISVKSINVGQAQIRECRENRSSAEKPGIAAVSTRQAFTGYRGNRCHVNSVKAKSKRASYCFPIADGNCCIRLLKGRSISQVRRKPDSTGIRRSEAKGTSAMPSGPGRL